MLEIRSETNEVVLGENKDLMWNNIVAKDFNFMSIEGLQDEMNVTAKIRYNHRGAKAVLRKRADGHMECIFEEPQRAPTPGQALVCYDGNKVVGGGVII